MKKIIFALAIAGTVATIAPNVQARTARPAMKSNVKTATFSVTKIHCAGCVQGITQAATKWPGVKSASVSLEKKRAFIKYDARKTSPAKLAKSLDKIGFPAKIAR